jgi:hypothetical protein
MKSQRKILWIDDNPDRDKWKPELEDATEMKVDFISVKGKNLEEELASIRERRRPAIIIIDHVLNDTASQQWVRLGSTVAGFLRETWKGCPIFGVTASPHLKEIDVERYAYDELVDYIDFGQYVRYIAHVVYGFEKCARVAKIEDWIRLLKCPKEETERIRGCMPHDVKTEFEKSGFASRAYRWFRQKLYGMPGFLYDRDWVAAFAGVRKGAIDKYLKHFDSAQYDGIFADPDHPRWWKAKLCRVIYGRCADPNATCRVSQDVASKVLRVDKKDVSVCYVCKEKWPEVVAHLDNSDAPTVEQMHLRCTVAHPLYAYEPMFEEMRMMM